jgi:hypothetical protein
VLSPTSLCIYNQQFIAKRVISLKNQLVYGAPLQPVLTFIVRNIYRQGFTVALGFIPGITGVGALVGVITNKFMYL